jgi:microcystin-dependent protein
MASTFSPSLRIELIGDGDQSGIWGQTTNTNLGTLIEQAIAGVVTINMLNANYALSNFNGVSDEARNQVIVLEGTNTAQRNLVVPLVEKTYTIKNTTGFDVKIVGASGLQVGVVVPNGVTTTVYCDGIDVYGAMSGVTGNFTVPGNATVTGNLTVTGSSTIAPIGSILMWSTGSAPTGYLLCNGDAVSRSTYAALFAVIGTTFGTGDTTTTFNLPNYVNRMPYGATVGTTGGSTTISTSNLPSHDHTFSGNTGAMNSNQAHNHSASDAGHYHDLNTDPPLTGIFGQTTGASQGPTAGFTGGAGVAVHNPYTLYAVAQISVGATNIDHLHAYNGTTSATGSGAAFLPPYLGINFIIKF